MSRDGARWITVANRLPFSLSPDKQTVKPADGGLVSALSGVKSREERLWVGCAPDHLTREDWPRLEKNLGVSGWKYRPVFPDPKLYDLYYNGGCNDVLWPLLHYQPELVSFQRESWQAYREVNQLIANEIAEIAEKSDLIWIHDFHLFLVPKLLKAARPELRTGFFLHVPFPSSEVFRQLPVREEILDSLLQADLVGFHDYSYLRHFSSTLMRLLGLESGFLSVKRAGRTTRLGVFPVSIDTEKFVRRSREPKVRQLAKEMRSSKSIDHFMFLGVDRLDYMKGIDLKLKAFRAMLRMFPQYREKVSLLQIAVPTRTGVPVYMKLARETARLVGEINGEFSTPNWAPIHYIYSSIDNDKLIALYKAADGLIVSSKRDGMNLVALEYIASQDTERPGLVLLSEFAGAISSMSHAIAMNPWDLEDTARKMQLAIEMPRAERTQRLQTMQAYLDRYSSTDWAASFITELEKQEPSERDEGPPVIEMSHATLSSLRDRVLASSPRRVALLLDYDGTLVPIEQSPELAVLTPQLKNELRKIMSYPWLDLVVVSGRDGRFLNNQFGDLPVFLAAEHGAKTFDPVKGRWQRTISRSRSSWYSTALKIITDYTARVPNSQVEKKHYSIAWHYRQSPHEYGEFQARKLAEELELGLANLPVSILRGKKVIEARAIDADKGMFAASYLERASDGTVPIAFGDDRTDEDMFVALKNRGLTVKVGAGQSAADFALASQVQTLPFLHSLLAAIDSRMSAEAPAALSAVL